jgi:hypothetical protein
MMSIIQKEKKGASTQYLLAAVCINGAMLALPLEHRYLQAIVPSLCCAFIPCQISYLDRFFVDKKQALRL